MIQVCGVFSSRVLTLKFWRVTKSCGSACNVWGSMRPYWPISWREVTHSCSGFLFTGSRYLIGVSYSHCKVTSFKPTLEEFYSSRFTYVFRTDFGVTHPVLPPLRSLIISHPFNPSYIIIPLSPFASLYFISLPWKDPCSSKGPLL